MRIMQTHKRRDADQQRTRRDRAARLLASYIRRAPAPYIAPMTTTELVLTWLVVGLIFLALFLLLGWMGSAHVPTPR